MKDSPVKFIERFYRSHRTGCIAAASVWLCGLVTHLYMLTNKLYNYFEMGNIFSTMPVTKGDTLAMGRVFIPFVTRLSTRYSSAMINGLLCFLLIGVSAYMIVELLDIRHALYAALCGAVLITFPGVASYLSYGVNTDVFCGAATLAILGIYLTEKMRWGWIAGIVCLGISVGTYQPFLSVAIAVVYLLLFCRVMNRKMSWKQLVSETVRYALILAAGFVFYYICLQIALKITGISMGSYHGVDEMTSFTLKGIVKGLVYTYGYFFAYFFTKTYANFGVAVVCNVIAAAVLILILARSLMAGESGYCTKERVSQIVVLVMVLPLGLNASPFLMADRVGNGVDRYMMFSVIMTYILLLKLTDGAEDKALFQKKLLHNLTLWAAMLSVVLTVVSCYYVCNMAYHRLDAVTQSIGNYLNRIAADLEKTEAWREGMPVYFANCGDVFNEYYDVELPEFDQITKVDGTELKPWYSYDALVNYMREYLHFPITQISEKQAEEILGSGEFADMGIYPENTSMRVIGGVLVVKLNADPQ